MKKNFEDYSFFEFSDLMSEYVMLAKGDNLVDLAVFKHEHPGVFSAKHRVLFMIF